MKIVTPEGTGTNGFKESDEAAMAGIDEILQTLHAQYGYDFSQYAPQHIGRRIMGRFSASGLANLDEFHQRIADDPLFAAQMLQDLSITVTEMFRDPECYQSIRQYVVPFLRTYPFIKIWHAGCATGEEAYSMAILLKEEGLYNRSLIYATDFNQVALDRAREGIYPDSVMKKYTTNYHRAGGKESFSDYYTSQYGSSIMNPLLKQNIVWANHNLVTDDIFAEVQLVLCRNVLIYFSKELQEKVHDLFYRSLAGGGILCLGAKEGLWNSGALTKYSPLDAKHRIYRKLY